jgi:hypothetical protein
LNHRPPPPPGERESAGVRRPYLRCISLGAGVQSTTLALMAAAGEIGPMPDAAIFADTQWEPREVYAHLDRLEKALPFPVHRVTAGSIRESIVRKSGGATGRFASVPWWTTGADGRAAPVRRQCTKEFKLLPIAAKQRALLGYAKGERMPLRSVEVWIGISTDEASRMKPAWNKWQENRWPLIDANMSRADCLRWLDAHGWSAPKSACIGCPFHDNKAWRRLRDDSPEEWADAVAVDAMIRDGGASRGMRGQQFAHRDLVPLAEVDLRTDRERGQLDLFENECEGICGV